MTIKWRWLTAKTSLGVNTDISSQSLKLAHKGKYVITKEAVPKEHYQQRTH